MRQLSMEVRIGGVVLFAALIAAVTLWRRRVEARTSSADAANGLTFWGT